MTNYSGTNVTTIPISAVEDTLGGFPVSVLNGTHTTISGFEIDSFNLIPQSTNTSGFSGLSLITNFTGDNSTVGGSSEVYSTRNLYFDACHSMIPSLQLRDTKISVNIKGTGMNLSLIHI